MTMTSRCNEITAEQFEAMKAAAPVVPTPLTVEAELKAARASVALGDVWINPVTRGYSTGDVTNAEVEHAKRVRYHEARYEIMKPAGFPPLVERGRDKYASGENWLVDRFLASVGNRNFDVGHVCFPQFCIDIRSNWAAVASTAFSSSMTSCTRDEVKALLDRFPLELSPEQEKVDHFAVTMGALLLD
jgi:hypothetical protein